MCINKLESNNNANQYHLNIFLKDDTLFKWWYTHYINTPETRHSPYMNCIRNGICKQNYAHRTAQTDNKIILRIFYVFRNNTTAIFARISTIYQMYSGLTVSNICLANLPELFGQKRYTWIRFWHHPSRYLP